MPAIIHLLGYLLFFHLLSKTSRVHTCCTRFGITCWW